jgi:hypothetical protein
MKYIKKYEDSKSATYYDISDYVLIDIGNTIVPVNVIRALGDANSETMLFIKFIKDGEVCKTWLKGVFKIIRDLTQEEIKDLENDFELYSNTIKYNL